MKRLLLALAILFASQIAVADSRIAVLDIEGELEPQVRQQLSDEVRSGILEVVNADTFTILTRENMLSVLNDMGKKLSCIEGECEIEIARNLGVDYVVSGNVIKVEGMYLLSLKLHDANTGALTGATRVEGKQSLDLIRNTNAKAKELTEQGLGFSPQKPPVNPTTTPQPKPNASGAKVLMQFNSEPPGAAVLLNGELICDQTPCTKPIPAGSHLVEIHKSKYNKWEVQFFARPDLIIKANLQPQFGWLNIDTMPSNVDVHIDGKYFGRTPIKNAQIDPGSHLISTESRCLLGKQKGVQIEQGKTESVVLSLEPSKTLLNVKAIDANNTTLTGKAYIGNEYIGNVPLQTEVSTCSSRVRVVVEHNGVVEERSHPLELYRNKPENVRIYFPIMHGPEPNSSTRVRPQKAKNTVSLGGFYVGVATIEPTIENGSVSVNGTIRPQWGEGYSGGNLEIADYDTSMGQYFNGQSLSGFELGYSLLSDGVYIDFNFTSAVNDTDPTSTQGTYPILVEDPRISHGSITLGSGAAKGSWGSFGGLQLGWTTYSLSINEDSSTISSMGLDYYSVQMNDQDQESKMESSRFRTGLRGGVFLGKKAGVRITGQVGADLTGNVDYGTTISFFMQ